MAVIEKQEQLIKSTRSGSKFELNVDDMRQLFKSYINIYRDELTFIRELTANANDSVTECWELSDKSIPLTEFKKQNPIIIGYYADESGRFLSIKETKGIGISPDRMRDVYLSVGNSTKRKSEHQIGAKGLGRLSVLRYVPEYYLTTVYDGICYEYKIEWYNDVPESKLRASYKTDLPNSTTVKVYLLESTKLVNIRTYCKEVLLYFNNVVYENLGFQYLIQDDIHTFDISENEYIISCNYEREENRRGYRNYDTDERLDTHNYGYKRDIPIVVGNIPYFVPLNALKESTSAPRYVKIKSLLNDTKDNTALKFTVNEVNLVQGRDDIEYSDKFRELIVEKMVKYHDYLINNRLTEIENIFSSEGYSDKLYLTLVKQDLFYIDNDVRDIFSASKSELMGNAIMVARLEKILGFKYEANLYRECIASTNWDLRNGRQNTLYVFKPTFENIFTKSSQAGHNLYFSKEQILKNNSILSLARSKKSDIIILNSIPEFENVQFIESFLKNRLSVIYDNKEIVEEVGSEPKVIALGTLYSRGCENKIYDENDIPDVAVIYLEDKYTLQKAIERKDGYTLKESFIAIANSTKLPIFIANTSYASSKKAKALKQKMDIILEKQVLLLGKMALIYHAIGYSETFHILQKTDAFFKILDPSNTELNLIVEAIKEANTIFNYQSLFTYLSAFKTIHKILKVYNNDYKDAFEFAKQVDKLSSFLQRNEIKWFARYVGWKVFHENDNDYEISLKTLSKITTPVDTFEILEKAGNTPIYTALKDLEIDVKEHPYIQLLTNKNN